MYVVSPVLDDPEPIAVPDGLVHGVPCVFKGCSGFYHPAAGATGVVLCSPWGFEDLVMRKSWRLLAEAISSAGYPCIRFDYPGTGNSMGVATDITSVTDWTNSINAAADFLKLNSGVRRFVFVGQSLGATLAVEAAQGRSDVAGLQLIAPVIRGRSYVRELSATATMVADRIGIKLEPAGTEGLSVLGFTMSKALVESLKGLDITKIEKLQVGQAVVFDQVDRKACAEAVVHLQKLGVDVQVKVVEPFHLFVSDATQIQPLPVAPERVIEALTALHPPSRSAFGAETPSFPSALVIDAFREEPIRFGPNNSLFGILCRPAQPRPGAPAIILLNRGLNPHIGWRRVSVDQARGLAAAGFTSLRFDVAGIGESFDAPDRPMNLIYSDLLVPDISFAIDMLTMRGHTRIALAGVCSGAYMALQAASIDARVTDIIVVNAQRFVWNPAESLEEVIRYGLRTMNDYVGDLKSGNALKKLIRSRRRLLPAMLFLVRKTIRNAVAHVPLRLRSLMMRRSMAGRVDALFTMLAERGTRVSLAFSEGDPGLMELRHYFGPGGRDMRFPNVSISTIPNADHNLTSTRASLWMLDHMIAFGSESSLREESRALLFQARPARRVTCEA